MLEGAFGGSGGDWFAGDLGLLLDFPFFFAMMEVEEACGRRFNGAGQTGGQRRKPERS